jgi:acyl-CoA thioester hydrolase
LLLAGCSEDGSRFMIRNEFYLPGGTLAAAVTSTAGWLERSARRLVAAPPALLEAMGKLARTPDFRELPSSVK